MVRPIMPTIPSEGPSRRPILGLSDSEVKRGGQTIKNPKLSPDIHRPLDHRLEGVEEVVVLGGREEDHGTDDQFLRREDCSVHNLRTS